MTHEAFVYSWRNRTTNRIYIGWHKGDLNDGYVCSSKKLKEEYTENPSNFERCIIACGSAKHMSSLETAILKAVDAKRNTAFYNQHNGNGLYHLKSHTTEHRMRMAKLMTGRVMSIESRLKMSKSQKARIRKPHSLETKIKMSATHKGKKGHSAEVIARINATRKSNNVTPWNKGKKGLQVAWNKGLGIKLLT